MQNTIKNQATGKYCSSGLAFGPPKFGRNETKRKLAICRPSGKKITLDRESGHNSQGGDVIAVLGGKMEVKVILFLLPRVLLAKGGRAVASGRATGSPSGISSFPFSPAPSHSRGF